MRIQHHKNQSKIMQPTKKTFQNEHGRWIERRKKCEILLCPSCGTKFLVTRKNQSTCIPCIYAPISKR